MVDGSRYNRMLHYGYNTTCPHNIGGEVQYGYKMEAGNIPNPKDSNMSPNPRRKEEMKVDGSRYNRMLHYGHKVIELGTHVVQRSI